MGNPEKSREILLQQIAETEAHLLHLRQQLERTEDLIRQEQRIVDNGDCDQRRWPLLQEEYGRYGRQMILNEIGLEGRRRFICRLHLSWETFESDHQQGRN
jgi:adenylyltransferase/sulfurtransferase